MKELELELTVLKYFIRALKLRDQYSYFTSINSHGFRLRREKRRVLPDNPFSTCKSLTDVAKVIAKLNRDVESHHHGMMPRGFNCDERIEKVTMSINHLIHFFLEPHIKDMNTFNAIGQSVFEATVSDLWGAEYLTQANAQMGQMEQQAPDKMRGMLWELYLKLTSEGKITCSFDEFMAKANIPPTPQPMPMGDGNSFIAPDADDYYDDGYMDFEDYDEDDDSY